jgi:hypothetical protein
VDPVTVALHTTLAKNIGHANEWLDASDYKSLAQSAGGLKMLAALLRARSDDAAWQEAAGKVLVAAGGLQESAGSEDAAKCRMALSGLNSAAAAASAVIPTGKPQELPNLGGIRPLMLLMDSIYADAKIAVLAGNTAGAKKQAYVLSELGRVVSNSQSTAKGRERWPELSSGFVEACLTAARSPSDDAQAVRQLLRGISQRCEACHETRSR